MQYRTDLAIELLDKEDINGIKHFSEQIDDLEIDRIHVEDEAGESYLGKPKGNYITISMPPISDSMPVKDEHISIIADEIRGLLPRNGTVFVVGLGNTSITPDALGPETIKGILATRHVIDEFKRIEGLEKLRSVAVMAPGVLGQTGVEAADVILAICKKIKPSAVIVIDALASGSLSRLGCTVQICDTGISPGAGVGNNRPRINKTTLGVPVIAIGVPTVVDAETIAADAAERANASVAIVSQVREKASPNGARMIVTPREIDLIIGRASKLISLSINLALHPDYDPHELSDAV